MTRMPRSLSTGKFRLLISVALALVTVLASPGESIVTASRVVQQQTSFHVVGELPVDQLSQYAGQKVLVSWSYVALSNGESLLDLFVRGLLPGADGIHVVTVLQGAPTLVRGGGSSQVTGSMEIQFGKTVRDLRNEIDVCSYLLVATVQEFPDHYAGGAGTALTSDGPPRFIPSQPCGFVERFATHVPFVVPIRPTQVGFVVVDMLPGEHIPFVVKSGSALFWLESGVATVMKATPETDFFNHPISAGRTIAISPGEFGYVISESARPSRLISFNVFSDIESAETIFDPL